MDPLVLAFVAAQAVALAVAVAIALARGRALDEIRAALTEADPGAMPFDAGESERIAARIATMKRRVDDLELDRKRRSLDLAYLADLVGVGIVRLTDDLRVEVANTAAHVFLGREPGTMVGRTAIEAIGDDRIEAIARQARDGPPSSEEVLLREPDGPVLVVRARRSPILGVWLVLEDVGELRRLQRIRAEFIDNLSHELRTPLTTIGLLVETLARDADAAGEAIPPRMRDRIAKLEVETGHVGQMVTELLDLARIEGGGTSQLHLDDVDLARVAAGSAERLRLFASRSQIEIGLDIVDPCPRVRGDGERLGQVFVNLLHNAVKFSPPGSSVVVGVRVGDGELVASVADRGIGIARADQARIFERFYKADRARTRGGTGLGLAIARHIVEAHGGRIWVESSEGAGSTFLFAIPFPGAAG